MKIKGKGEDFCNTHIGNKVLCAKHKKNCYKQIRKRPENKLKNRQRLFYQLGLLLATSARTSQNSKQKLLLFFPHIKE